MNKTAGSIVAERAPHHGTNGKNGVNGIAIVELPILGAPGPARVPSTAAPQSLPVPVFPRHPEKCGNVEPDLDFCRVTEIPTGRALPFR